VVSSTTTIEQKLLAAEGKLQVHCGFYGGLVPGNFKDLPDLMRAGVFGIKCFLTHSGIDEFPNATADDLAKAMPLIEKTG
jgi:allantoinase